MPYLVAFVLIAVMVAAGVTVAAPGLLRPGGPALLPPAGARTILSVPAAGLPEPSASAVTLSIAGATPSAVSLDWTETSDAFFSQYTVLESTNGTAGPWESVGVVTTKTTTSFAVTGLSPGSAYGWEIEETGLFENTADSNAVLGSQPTLSFLKFHVLSASSIELNWTNNATYGGLLSFEEYQVWVRSSGATTSQAILTSETDNATVVTGLSAGTDVLYYVNTTDCASGCGSPLVTQSNAVTYGTPLALGANVVADRVVVDANQSDLFTCTPSGGESPFNFTWQIGNGSFVVAPSSTSFEFRTPGAASVTCGIEDSLHSQVTASTTVQVSADPSAMGTANRTTADVDQSVQLSCAATLGTGPFSYTWQTGAGQLLSGAIVSVAYAAPGTLGATCFAVDSTGTTATSTVTLVVSPALAANVTASSAAAAPGTNLTFTAVGINGSGGFGGFAWEYGDGSHGSGPVVGHPFATSGNFTVTVTLNDSNGARATASIVVDISAIRPVVSSFVTALSTGGWWNVTAGASGGAGGPYTYLWTLGDGTTVAGAVAAHQYEAAGAYSVQLKVTDRLGASVTTTVAAVTVTAPPVPSPPSQLPLELEITALLAFLFIVLVVAVLLVRRRRRDKAYPAVAGRVPATDPATAVRGMKVCPKCGTANVSTRKTCQACGASLGRSVSK